MSAPANGVAANGVAASGVADVLRVLVVDDEAPARHKLQRLLGELPGVAVVGEAASGHEAVAQVGALAPDVVLLDIEMPGLDGFGVVEAVGVDAMPAVVFQTAYDEHALKAFEVRAIDYLLKPVAPARLREALDRVRARRASLAAHAAAEDERRARLAALVDERNRALRRILVHDERQAHLLPVETIWLARAERNYVALHSTRGVFRVRGTIGALARRLDPEQFLQVNRSDIVRVDAIRELQPWSHGDYRIVLPDGSALLWSRRFRGKAAGRFGVE